MTTAQANQVMRLVLGCWPELMTLRRAGQVQFINGPGQFRIIPIWGGELPKTLTVHEIKPLVDTVLAGGDPILAAWRADGSPMPDTKNWFTRPDRVYAAWDAEDRPLNIERW